MSIPKHLVLEYRENIELHAHIITNILEDVPDEDVAQILGAEVDYRSKLLAKKFLEEDVKQISGNINDAILNQIGPRLWRFFMKDKI